MVALTWENAAFAWDNELGLAWEDEELSVVALIWKNADFAWDNDLGLTWSDETFEPVVSGAVYPDPSQVALGVQYGPHGDDYIGTLEVGSGGGSATLAKQEEILAELAKIIKSGGIGSGPRAIKITAVSDGDGVPGVRFGIVGTKITGYSDAEGLRSLYVDGDDGDLRTYTLRTVAPAGYASVEDREVTVGSDDVSVEIELTLTALETAEAPLCNVLLPIYDQGFKRLPKTSVHIEFVELLPGAVNSGVVMNRQWREVSDNNGEVRLELGRLCRYQATYRLTNGEPKTVVFDTTDEGSFIVLEPQ